MQTVEADSEVRNAGTFYLEAQTYAVPFYERLGYSPYGEEFYGCRHSAPLYVETEPNSGIAGKKLRRVTMETVLLVVQLMIAIAMIVVILFQRTAQDGGGLVGGGGGGGTMGGLFTARGSANLLTRTTAVLATLFILNSLTLGFIASRQHQTGSVIDQMNPQAPATKTVPATPAAPAVPTANSPAARRTCCCSAAGTAQTAPAAQPAPPPVPLK